MQHLNRPTPTTWGIALLAAGLATNWLFGCGSNLVAIAVVAAVTLRFRIAAIVALGVWFESQLLGFTIFAYPHDAMTFAWGIALGVGTLIAANVAAGCSGRARLGAFLAAFTAYELALVAFALITHSGLAGFSAAIVGQLFASNALVALGGLALYLAMGWLESALVRTARSRRHA